MAGAAAEAALGGDPHAVLDAERRALEGGAPVRRAVSDLRRGRRVLGGAGDAAICDRGGPTRRIRRRRGDRDRGRDPGGRTVVVAEGRERCEGPPRKLISRWTPRAGY